MIKIEALPQVQKLDLYLEDPDDLEDGTSVLNDTFHFTTCYSFDVMVVVGDRERDSISLNLGMTTREMETTLNELETFQNIGKMAVRKKRSWESYSIVFILLAVDMTPSELVPTLKLESEHISINCSCPNSSLNYSIAAGSLALTQNLTFADGFYVGFNRSSSPRFTPVLPVNISQHQLEMELNGLLKWICRYPAFHPVGSIRILFRESYEDGTGGTDDSTAFCGRYSRRNPGVVWDNSKGLKNHHHVRVLACSVL